MKAVLCYFSGTGNTKMVCEKYAEEFKKRGESLTLYNIEKKEPLDLSEYELVGIAYPVWAFNAPVIVLDFVKALTAMKSPIPAFIVKTSGEGLALNNASSDKLKSLLKKRNLIVKNEYHYLMPYNIIFRHTSGMAYRMWQAVEEAAPADVGEIFGGKTNVIKSVPFGRPITAVMRIQQWGGRFNGKRYKTTDDCVNCGLCVKSCPVGNIKSEDGKIKFGGDCLMCMRCVMFCPKNAIRAGLFDSWRVNGKYVFSEPEGEDCPVGEDKKHRDFCRKSYERYFARQRAKAEETEK